MDEKITDGTQPLRDRQETFCQIYSTGLHSASAAYRLSGYTQKNTDAASAKLTVKDSIKARIAFIQAQRAEKAEITRELLAEEYKEAHVVAVSQKSATGMVAATAGRARLYGLDKQVIEQQDAHKDLTATDAEQAREYAEFVRWRDSRRKGEITAPRATEGHVVPMREQA